MANNQQRHQQRQQRLKESVDAKVEKASEERGIVLVLTGNGKGKSSSAYGCAVRAVGHGQHVKVAQFIKGTWDCGERNILEQHGVEFAVMATGFTWDTQDKQADIDAAQRVWKQALPWFSDPSIDLIVLDELTYMLSYHYLPVEEVVNAIQNRPKEQSVIVTGRACHRAVLEIADTVSEVKSVKHAFESGIKARKGIDW